MSDQAWSFVKKQKQNNDGRIGCDHTNKKVFDLKHCSLQEPWYDKL